MGTETVDVFAYGTMLWEAVVVDIPFANLDPQDIRERVLQGQMLSIPNNTSSAMRSVIQSCWTMDRNTRPGMTTVLQQLRECACVDDRAARSRRPRTAGPASGRQLVATTTSELLDSVSAGIGT